MSPPHETFPEELSSAIRWRAVPLVEGALKEGWSIFTSWEDIHSREVKVLARSPWGSLSMTICEETKLIEKLANVLGRSD